MNFNWAMDRLRENKCVRREVWPVKTIEAGSRLPGGDGGPDFVVPKTFTLIWHLFMMKEFLEPECAEYWTGGLINGWGGSVGGGSETDKNGMLYSPTDDDRAATDWKLYKR